MRWPLTRRPGSSTRHAVARLCGVIALTAAAATPAPGVPPSGARELYLAAQARETALRQALEASPPAPAPTRDSMRQVVAAYRQVVLRYPTSGYCDNALWLGSQLAAEAYVRHGVEQDRQTAIRLLEHLVSEYPASPLLRRARRDLARVKALTYAGSPAAVPALPPATRPAQAAPASPPTPARALVLVRDVRRRTTADGAVVEVELDGPVEYREERLDTPSRVFYDLAGTRTLETLRDAAFEFESGLVRRIRIGRWPNETTRLVIETTVPARCTSAMSSGPIRLVVTCRDLGATAAADTAPGAQPAAAAPVDSPALPAPLPASSVPAAAAPVVAAVTVTGTSPPASAPGVAAGATAVPRAISPAAPAPPAANGRGGYSMARQLGLRVGRIVIDAGHGGRDPGASGPGFTESALTLDIALRLEKLLTKEPGIEVVLTRRTDEYVGLQERTAIANREGADLFLSIHANASRNRNARGVESYLLNFASTPEAAAVAARENASSTLTMSHLNDLVKQIALNNKLDESRDLARHVQTTLVQKLRPSNQGLKDLGVKQAPFVVLVGASMPSILVEVSFLSHRQEGRLLSTGTFRQRIADALFDGLRGYLRTLKRAETDAPEPGPEPGQGQADDPSAGRLQ